MSFSLPSKALALAFAATAAIALSAQQARAQNDVASGAITLALDDPEDGTTAGAADNYRTAGATGSGQDAGPDVVYKFIAPGKDRYAARITQYSPLVSPPAGINFALFVAAGALTSAAGPTSITYAAVADATNVRDEEVFFDSPAAGSIFHIVVDQEAGAGGPFTIVVTRLRAESEQNNTPATANPPRAGIAGSIVQGTLVQGTTVTPILTGTDGDPDFYSLGTLPAGARVFALVDSLAAANLDTALRVTTATDTLEFDDNDGFNSGGVGNAVIAGTLLTATAEVFLRVNAFTSGSEPYHLHAVVQTGTATPEVETNDTAGTANAGGFSSGAISSGTDEDYFKVGAHAAGDVIFVAIDCDPDRDGTVDLDSRIQLRDASGTTVLIDLDGNTTNVASTTPSPATLTGATPEFPGEGFVFTAKDATDLFVRVTGGGSTGAYILSIAINSNQPQVYLDQDIHDFAGTTVGAGSGAQTVTITGRSLTTGAVTVTVTAGFQVDAGSGFGPSATLTPSGAGTLDEEVDVRFNPASSTSPVFGTLTVSVAGGASETVALRGDLPTITATGIPLSGFKSPAVATPSAVQSFTAAAIALASSPLDITTTAGFQISTGTAFSTSLSLAPDASGDVPPTTINVRYVPVSTAPAAGTITLSSANPNAASVQFAVSGRIPTLTATPTTLASFSSALNATSAQQSFTLSGSALDPSQVVTITAPTAFKVRTGAGTFGAVATATADGSGNLSTTVDVVYAPTSGTGHTGVVMATASGAPSPTVTVTGVVANNGGNGGGHHGGGGCVAAAHATPAAALPWAMAAVAALALRGLRRREARA